MLTYLYAAQLVPGVWSAMFKKPVDVKTIQRLSGADKKKLRRAAKERFPQASDADLDAILPPKVMTSFVSPLLSFSFIHTIYVWQNNM